MVLASFNRKMKYARLVLVLFVVQHSAQADQGQYQNAAVATDVPVCSQMGK